MKIMHVVGARPNFMKAAPVVSALGRHTNVTQILTHTGQHYDEKMSSVFFGELGLPEPDINLEVGSASHARQTGDIMIRFEQVILEHQPELVLVYGDVNSTVAAALDCSKLHIPVGHVEAGLRSFDRTMPEEINRLITDQMADYLFTPSSDGDHNLLNEGVSREKIHLVGNVMIDTLVRLLPKAEEHWNRGLLERIYEDSGVVRSHDSYCLVTLHRPSNVDPPEILKNIMSTLESISRDIPVIFPIHPRTRNGLVSLGYGHSDGEPEKMRSKIPSLMLIPPLGYLDFLALQQRAAVVVTDSGGIQEETTYMGVPCLTVRTNTERPITLTTGTNILVGQDMERLEREVRVILDGSAKRGTIPPLWDGHASERIANIILSL